MANTVFAANRAEESRVTTFELFFDLVFVLAIAQCTTLIADELTWKGLLQGMLVLGLLWWAWVGYAWLTSVVNPEHASVRLALLAAMVGLVVAAMSVPDAFGGTGMLFVASYAVVSLGQVALFLLASRDDPQLRHAVLRGLSVTTTLCVALLAVGAMLDDTRQAVLWAVALAIHIVGPFLDDATGWRLVPGHFAERHGLIFIIALGEMIVAIGVGAKDPGSTTVVVGSVLGTLVAGFLWWMYFDVLSIVAERRLEAAPVGQERNRMARDAFSVLHFPMVAGVMLVALGLKETLAHVHDPLTAVSATALLGGTGLTLVGFVAYGWRTTGRVSWDSLVVAALLGGLVPLCLKLEALHSLALLTAVLLLLVVYKVTHYRSGRERVRHDLTHFDSTA